MNELPTLKLRVVLDLLTLDEVETVSDARIADMIERARDLGLPLHRGGPLEDLTLRELAWLVDDVNGSN